MANIYFSFHSTLHKVYCIVVEYCFIENDELILSSFKEVLKYNYYHQILNFSLYHNLFFSNII